jgi:hypothetical protein
VPRRVLPNGMGPSGPLIAQEPEAWLPLGDGRQHVRRFLVPPGEPVKPIFRAQRPYL